MRHYFTQSMLDAMSDEQMVELLENSEVADAIDAQLAAIALEAEIEAEQYAKDGPQPPESFWDELVDSTIYT